MLQRQVEFTGDEECQSCEKQLDTEEDDTTWKESPSLVLLCTHCEGTSSATISQDVLILERA